MQLYNPDARFLLPGVRVILRDTDGHHYHASAHSGAGLAHLRLFDIQDKEEFNIDGLEIPSEFEVVLNPLEPFDNRYELVTINQLQALVVRQGHDDDYYVRTDEDHQYSWRNLIAELDAIEPRDFNTKVTPFVYYFINESLEVCSNVVIHQDLQRSDSLINKRIKGGNFFLNSRDVDKAVWCLMGFDKEELGV